MIKLTKTFLILAIFFSFPLDISADELTAKAQRLLTKLGYNAGPVDGLIGKKTLSALDEFYISKGLRFDGVLDRIELEDLQSALNTNAGSSKSAISPKFELDLENGKIEDYSYITDPTGNFDKVHKFTTGK